MGVEIDLSGISDLVQELELKVTNASKVENEALQEAIEPILQDAKQTTAFIDRSGKLRKSLSKSKVASKNGIKSIKAESDSPHAKVVEFGHSGKTAAPHPFLQPAFERHKKEAQEILKNKLREALK